MSKIHCKTHWKQLSRRPATLPAANLSAASLRAVMRDYYEGTPYDTTLGLASAPFGTPDRYQTIGAAGDPGKGSWERTVSIYRTTYTWVVQMLGK